jgi:hypothetical protein
VTRVSFLVAALALLLLGAATPQNVPPNTTPKKQPKAHHPKAHVRRAKPIPLTHAPNSAAERYARLSPSDCLAQLGARKIQYTREAKARGVEIPVRIKGPLNGVLYRTDFPDRERGKVPWEIFDCRLVLSLDDFGETLRAHSIVEVRIFSCFRPPPKSFPANEVGKRHEGALAVDVREFRKEDGTTLNVLEQFNGKLGAALCGPGAVPPNPDSAEARELHEIACAAADSHLFNSVLTPNYNPAHKNHFHVELTPNVDWFMLR